MPQINIADDIFLGSTQVDRVYWGSTQVWSQSGADPIAAAISTIDAYVGVRQGQHVPFSSGYAFQDAAGTVAAGAADRVRTLKASAFNNGALEVTSDGDFSEIQMQSDSQRPLLSADNNTTRLTFDGNDDRPNSLLPTDSWGEVTLSIVVTSEPSNSTVIAKIGNRDLYYRSAAGWANDRDAQLILTDGYSTFPYVLGVRIDSGGVVRGYKDGIATGLTSTRSPTGTGFFMFFGDFSNNLFDASVAGSAFMVRADVGDAAMLEIANAQKTIAGIA
jgi:hypothetical protein